MHVFNKFKFYTVSCTVVSVKFCERVKTLNSGNVTTLRWVIDENDTWLLKNAQIPLSCLLQCSLCIINLSLSHCNTLYITLTLCDILKKAVFVNVTLRNVYVKPMYHTVSKVLCTTS